FVGVCVAVQIFALICKWQDETGGSQGGLSSGKWVRIRWIIGGAVKPLELFRRSEHDEVETLAETAGWRMARHLQHSLENVIWYRRLLELPNHSPPSNQ